MKRRTITAQNRILSSKGGIEKVFYWGERVITKETAVKKAGLEK